MGLQRGNMGIMKGVYVELPKLGVGFGFFPSSFLLRTGILYWEYGSFEGVGVVIRG